MFDVRKGYYTVEPQFKKGLSAQEVTMPVSAVFTRAHCYVF